MEQNENCCMKTFTDQEPIAALATPWGESAIAVVRLSGSGTLEKLEPLFSGKRKIADARGHSLLRGSIRLPDSGEAIDEVLVAVFRDPASYTGEDAAEIFCHGSPAVVTSLLQLLTGNGFRNALPGEFTQRAFLNGKMDLTRAEAVNEIIRSKTDKARALALNRLNGSVENRIRGIKDDILNLLAAVEIHIDYPEEDLDEPAGDAPDGKEAQDGLSRLLSTYSAGRIIQEGLTVVLAGRTNAGKSTLFNLMLKEDRAIVSEVHGTTRDYLEGAISIQGIPVRLFDTAGLRATDDPLEREGMRRTENLIANANILIYIVDATAGITPEDSGFLNKHGDAAKLIMVFNKIDLHAGTPGPDAIPVSAKDGMGLDLLNAEIVKKALGNASLDTSEAVIDSLRQKECLETALAAMRDFSKGARDGLPLDVLAVCLKDALDALGELTGEVATEEVLRRMFSNFCVGK
jgi:tRNA modification GTPase